MGSRTADPDRRGARGWLRPAARGRDGLGPHAIPLSWAVDPERPGAFAAGAASGRHRLAAADPVRHSRADRIVAVGLVRYPIGLHHGGRPPPPRRPYVSRG